MCVDDYQFRHYSAIRPKECRRLIFINQDQIQKAFLVNISQFQQNGEVALCKILFHLSSKGLPIGNRVFYWAKFNISIQPGDYCKVPFSALHDREIIFRSMIKIKNQPDDDSHQGLNGATEIQQEIIQKIPDPYDLHMDTVKCDQCMLDENQGLKRKEQSSNDQNVQQQWKSGSSSPKVDNLQTKRLKESQRQIGQVIIAVKKWRKLYQSKRLNLTKSARVIGISKKSLDDYFLVLRVGQILGFDFNSKLSNKMGELRAYIRTFDYKITGKLSKQVKCFELVPDFQIQNPMDSQQEASVPNCSDLE